MDIFDNISSHLQSGNNIKHITLNTKHKTLDTTILDLPSGESSGQVPAAASGLASLSRPVGSPGGGQVVGEVIPALVNSDFQYISISLKTPTLEERLEVNVDFRLRDSAAGKFNKLIFNLVGWNRRREFFDNIQDIKDWRGYQDAYKMQEKTDFIGKGRPRQKQSKKSAARSQIRPETSVLLKYNQHPICHLWIEDAHFIIPLYPWTDSSNLFCAKGEYVDATGTRLSNRGGWV